MIDASEVSQTSGIEASASLQGSPPISNPFAIASFGGLSVSGERRILFKHEWHILIFGTASLEPFSISA